MKKVTKECNRGSAIGGVRSGGAIGKPAKRITSLPKIGMTAGVGVAWCGRVSGQQQVSGFIKGTMFENLASLFRRS